MTPRGERAPRETPPRGGGRGGPSVLLACYDRTERSANALAYAAGVAARSGARLVVVTVDRSLDPDGPPAPPAHLDEICREIVRAAGEDARGCEVAVEPGDPASAIRRLATERRADLIVVGRSRRAWLHPFGSVSGRLTRQAGHPVLVVP